MIADQARMRRDLTPLRPGDEITTELKPLTARRADLVADRIRVVNRLRGLFTSTFPALDRALDDLTNAGPLVLLSGYQTPATIRAAGAGELEAWLRARKVRNAAKLAAAAASAAARQHTTLPGEKLTASIVATMAQEVMTLNEQIKDTDRLIEGRFHQHKLAPVIISLPGIGVLRYGFPRRHRRRHDPLRHAPPPGRLRRAGTRPVGLRAHPRQPAPTPAA